MAGTTHSTRMYFAAFGRVKHIFICLSRHYIHCGNILYGSTVYLFRVAIASLVFGKGSALL